ncbi:MAG TPA: DNA repair protein RecO [Pyrinomonadaceae bacterium]|nr:DNA repair protein RecO [Pyrinomonadaceae bacterium]
MPVVETESLVLRTYNFGEADKIVVWLTRAEGVVRGVAKGCRKLKSRYGASLEPFTLAKITYHHKENQELVSLRQAEILRSHFDLMGHAEILTGLSYMGDLIIEFSAPFQPNEHLFRMVTACLDAIAQNESDLQIILRYFEVWLLKLEGFLPDIRHCGECGKVFEGTDAPFLGLDIMLRCAACSQGRGSVVSRRLQQLLSATQKQAPAIFAKESREVPAATRREMAELTHRLIGRALERQPRLRSTFSVG